MGTFLSFLFFTALVGAITYWRTHSEKLGSRKGYFLAGRSLNGWVIAGSLMLTNLSAANITGMTAQVYGGSLAPIAWTVTVIPPLILFAAVILPVFLKNGYATIPEFLENRYGTSTRQIVTGLFLFNYILGGMPVALYGGAIAIIHLFDVPALLNLNETACVWIIVWALGIVGGLYALFGGLKGVAISDTLNGIGLLIGGLLVFIFGAIAIGQGHFGSGLEKMFTENTEKLNAIGDQADLVPFSVLFTGMLVHNLFYWCANQFIVQRCFGARSLKEGQKGVLIAGYFKILNVFYIAIPGVIAFHLFGPGHFDNNDWAYPTLVREVMPGIFVGFFAAVIFGAVLSTFNSVLNSSVTLFALDIYKPLWGKQADEAQLVRTSKRVGSILVIVTLFVAPLIMYFEQGIFQYMVKTEILFGSPIFLVLFMGYFSKSGSTRAANITLISYLVSLVLFQHILSIHLHFLHILAILFSLHVGLYLLLSKAFPRGDIHPTQPDTGGIDLRPWRWLPHVSIGGLLFMLLTYVAFSPLGLVRESMSISVDYLFIGGGLLMAAGIFGIPTLLRLRGRA